MANERIPAPKLPQAPGREDGLLRWARDMKRFSEMALLRIVNAMNGGQPVHGTWSPGISGDTTGGSATYTHRRGRYTLHGQDVELWGDVAVSAFSTSPTGNLRVHGLPFKAHEDTPETVGVALVRSGITLSANMTQVTALLQTASQNVRFQEWGSAQTAALIQASAATTPLRLEFWLRYRKQEDEVIDPEA